MALILLLAGFSSLLDVGAVGGSLMADIVSLVGVVLLFALSILYVRGCERLK